MANTRTAAPPIITLPRELESRLDQIKQLQILLTAAMAKKRAAWLAFAEANYEHDREARGESCPLAAAYQEANNSFLMLDTEIETQKLRLWLDLQGVLGIR